MILIFKYCFWCTVAKIVGNSRITPKMSQNTKKQTAKEHKGKSKNKEKQLRRNINNNNNNNFFSISINTNILIKY